MSGQTIAVFILMGWSLLTVAMIFGSATDQDRPRFPGKVEERWWDR